MAVAVHADRVDFTNQAVKAFVNSAVTGTSFYLGAHWFTSIPAPTAAVFGVTAAAVNLITEPIFNHIFAEPRATSASRTFGQVITVLTNAVTAALVAKLVTGYAITLEAAITLTLSAFVACIVVYTILDICGCGDILN